MNRELWQRQADREKRLQRLESKLDSVNRRRKWENRITVVLLAVLLVLAGFFTVRVTPVRVDGGTSTQPQKISFTQSHIEWIDRKYNSSMENGFCLFGTIQDGKVVVEKVEFIDNPFKQSYEAMSFTCIPQILARSKHLLLEEDYQFVGAIHTHPDVARLSDLDWRTFEKFDHVVSVFGVYNGRDLTVYSDPDQEKPLTKVLRTQ